MLKLVVKKQNISLVTYLGPDIVVVKKPNISTIALNDTYIYVEPFIYVDGGLYDSEGTLVDAGYYDTAMWAVTFNGGYV
jgi:hypothetical protein